MGAMTDGDVRIVGSAEGVEVVQSQVTQMVLVPSRPRALTKSQSQQVDRLGHRQVKASPRIGVAQERRRQVKASPR